MKYQKWYNRLIQYRIYSPPVGYFEQHHIVPKSLGGSNDSFNLVCLSAREHFIAHLLLSKIYPPGTQEHIKMCYALNRMKDHKSHYRITARRYDYIRKQHSNNMRKTKGQRKWITNGSDNKFIHNAPTVLEQNWYYGKTFSKEHATKLDYSRRNRDSSNAIDAMLKAKKTYVMTDETRELKRQANLGKTHSDETKQKMSKMRKGILKSEEHKKKISSALKGKRHSEQRKAKISKTYLLIRPDNKELTITNLKQFCKDNNLRYMTMRSFIDTNKIIPPAKSNASEIRHNCSGWKIFSHNQSPRF